SPGGKPCATSVVSSATTASDSRTSSVTRITPVPSRRTHMCPHAQWACEHMCISGRSRRPLHLHEPRPVAPGHLAESRAPVGAELGGERPLSPRRAREREGARPPLAARVVGARLDERLREAAPGQIGPHAEAEPHLVALAHEVEEADELAVVADHGTQALATR